jgi:hypothetical protein
MSILARWLLAVFIVAGSVVPRVYVYAQQQSISEAERQTLKTVIAEFEAALRVNDMKSVLKVMPPKIWSYIRDKGKVTDEQLMEAISQAMAQALANVTIVSATMKADEAQNEVTPDGLGYVLIPTETVVDVQDYGRVRVISKTLAILEDGKWYLLRISDPQQQGILKQVYPGFAAIELPGDKMEDVK